MIEKLIQIPCEKVDKGKILYQAVYKEMREETGFHIILKYLIKDDRFNCDLYITDIIERKSSQ